jgi:hypothetical protein
VRSKLAIAWRDNPDGADDRFAGLASRSGPACSWEIWLAPEPPSHYRAKVTRAMT